MALNVPTSAEPITDKVVRPTWYRFFTDLLRLTNGKLEADLVSTFMLTVLDDADAATARTTLGLEYGSWTPTITAGSGSFTSVSATGIYIKWGRLVWTQITVTITTNGTAAGNVTATLGVTADSAAVLVGRENAVTGSILQGIIGTTTVSIFDDDNAYPGGSGRTLIVSGAYRVAS